MINKLLFVCINYNNEIEVKKYLENIKEVIKNPKEIIVVNNSLTKNLDKILKLEGLIINIFTPHNNLGYLNGLFYGINEYKKSKELPQWIVLSNTDIEIKKFKFKDKNYSSNIYCIAPEIFSVFNRSYQNPFYKFRLQKKRIKRIIMVKRFFLLDIIYEKLSQIKNKISLSRDTSSSYIYAPHGSFFLLKKDFFLMKEQKYFNLLYGEELFIAEELRKINKKIYFDKNLRINHLEHSTTNLMERKIKNKILIESLYQILRKYY